jgi:hypothetical protein
MNAMRWILLGGLLVFGCSSGSDPSPSDSIDTDVAEEIAIFCWGAVCQGAADCAKKGPCISATSCLDGCCEYDYVPSGTACELPCETGGVCNATGECVDTEPVTCQELDGNPCTAPVCDPQGGGCGPEQPVADGVVPMDSFCWSGMVCLDGKIDESSAIPTALQEECAAQDAAVNPLGCVEQVACVDSEPACVVLLKDEGTHCWKGLGGQTQTCPGASCDPSGECLPDAAFDVECGAEAWPVECDVPCQECTTLTCYWIDDPANPGADKKVQYCKPEAIVGDGCSDGNECTVEDTCVLASQADGPKGKETLGECQPGPGTSKEDCLEELVLPVLPCLKAGVDCALDGGCALDSDKADAWCHPPGAVCFNKNQTYCSHLDTADGKWNAETGCHIVIVNPEGCDDGDACTADQCEDDGQCSHSPVDSPECNCQPDCNGKDCGPDGCGGSCGECQDDNPCTEDLCLDAGLCSFGATNQGVQCVGDGLCLGKCDNGACVEAAVETCNGKDDDCDDLIDEEANLCPAGWECQNGQCVEDCVPVNGGWTDWSCGSCSVDCGGGTMSCSRSCANPVPSCGGLPCSGSNVKNEACNPQSCVNTLPTGTTVYAQGEQVVSGVVPAGKTAIQFKLWGAGGAGGFPGHGGGGAHVAGTLNVAPGDQIELRVGGGGLAEGSGGGATYVYRNGQVVMVAGGGGGAGSDGAQNGAKKPATEGAGGAGGPLNGSGQNGTGTNYLNTGSGGGGGGSQSFGGAGGISNNQSQYNNCTLSGQTGSAHTGGKNSYGQCTWGDAASYEDGGDQKGGNGSCGGGGAGYFGGGSGACMWTYSGGGGGGGSSWVDTQSVVGASSAGGNLQTPGGVGVNGYQGAAGRGGNTGDWSNWPAVTINPEDGKPGLIIMTL